MRRLAALLVALAAGSAAAHVAMQRVPARFHVDMLQPLPVATNWGSFGLLLGCIFTGMLIAASVAYLLALGDLAKDDARFNVATVMGVSIAAMALLWTFAPLFSSDAYAYAAYGEMARLGIDPYATQATRSADPVVSAAIWQWSGALPVCVYGEVFVRIAQVFVSIAHPLGVRAQIEAMRVLSSIALLVAALLLGRLRKSEGRATYATALLAWNPVLLWCAVEGHNDALMLAVALAGIAVARRHLFAGMILAAASALIKIPAAVVPAAIAYVRARRTDEWVYPIAYGVFVAAVIYAGSYRWLASIQSHVATHGHYAPAASLQGLTSSIAGAPAGIVIAIAIVGIAIAAIARTTSGAQRAIAITLALWLLIPNPYAWYAFWLVPLFAWLPVTRAHYVTAALTLSATLRYLPDAVATPSPAINALLSALALLLFGVGLRLAASRERIPLL